jgi:surface protein
MHAVRFNADISGWTTTSLKYASEAFFGAISFNGDVSNWDVTNVIDLTKMVRCVYIVLLTSYGSKLNDPHSLI